ncbi:stimulator of interferon genes protein-like isoform X1 [Neodiprion fabricii]|uniref:stimulator of interferon genes protein-like isoform X1 n=2 Tax=Neodiprion fabricii TaxID=2872261 RepID=UPI001ED8C87C|nr:stimulator of interferon genes protein-like isoform X1 [Neodiprion fabricii]XP_046418353.1 stimulator of interferon genes protein-like isoform X1 [Neodiprion fabricii]XP_046418354.1 stimulator of interferon genes protein-like isoform X1 [Neodiprion fabricii]XP_046418355.1 stimulator of interferon genes protein-like isoform X1 [Neodiprion fabricii]
MASAIDCTELQVVKELRGGGLLYPKNIPGDRGNTAMITQIILIILLMMLCAYYASRNRDLNDYIKYCVYCTASNIILISLCNFLMRITNLFEELRHVHARYDDKILKVFVVALEYNTLCIIIIAVCISCLIAMIMAVENPIMFLWSHGPEPYICSLLSSMIILRLINVDESRLDTVLKVSQMKGLDYGSSMAYSYFYGYLNIVLPSVGDEKKGLYENIKVYESQNGVEVPVKKLFILIPTSLHIPPNLEEASYYWMESAKKLESVVKHRAGVVHRTYHNSVYKIHPRGQRGNDSKVYVITEGATPLLTFYEVLEHSDKDSSSYKEYKKEIAGSFYRTLRHIIRSKPECRDLCELIYYEDYDSDGKKVNIAEILLEKIDEQTSLASHYGQ